MTQMAGATRGALVRCIQHQHAALAQLSACLDNPACDFDRAIVNECIDVVTTAQAVVRRILEIPAGTGHSPPC